MENWYEQPQNEEAQTWLKAVKERDHGLYEALHNGTFNTAPTNKDKMEKFTDETEISFGKYKGTKLANIPDSYFKFLYENQKCFGELKTYIEENIEGLIVKEKRNANQSYPKIISGNPNA